MNYKNILQKYIKKIQSIFNKQTFDVNNSDTQKDISYSFNNEIKDNEMIDVGKDIKKENSKIYESISNDFIRITRQAIEMKCLKSTIYFNLFFYLEIKIKAKLINYGVDLKKISKAGHFLDKLIELKSGFPIEVDELKKMLKTIIYDDKMVEVFMNEHENFKYNSFKNNSGETNNETLNLIFENNIINKKEEKGVEDIIKWMEKNI